MNRYKLIILLGVLLGLMSSCSKDFLEADLQTTKKFEDGIKTARDMHNLVKGVYNRMNESSYYGRDFLMYGEVRSDNAWNDEGTGRFVDQSRFDMLANDGDARDTWTQMYRCIQLCNIVINNTTAEGDADEINYYKGQAYGIRALVYFDLNRLFGQAYVQNPASPVLGVPIVTEFSNTADATPKARATYAEVNKQIEDDFAAALTLMGSNNYSDGKIEMTANAVIALRGRYYLYNKEYTKAITDLEPLLTKYNLISAPLYVGSWATDESQESIFEMAYTEVDYHGTTSYTYMWEKRGYKDVFGTVDLMTKYANDDVRFPFTGLYSGTKTVGLVKFPFDVKSHNIRLIHFGEVIMNYVEACVQSGTKTTEALTEINKLRAARHTGAVTPWVAADLTIANVLAERRLELATEGHRYFDLCRTGTTINHYDTNGNAFETISVPSDRLAFPIPEAEMDANPNIKNQNPGY